MCRHSCRPWLHRPALPSIACRRLVREPKIACQASSEPLPQAEASIPQAVGGYSALSRLAIDLLETAEFLHRGEMTYLTSPMCRTRLSSTEATP